MSDFIDIFPIEKVAVIGAGTMGIGIAHVLAQKGIKVIFLDNAIEVLQKAQNTIAQNLDRQIKRNLVEKKAKEKILSKITLHTELEKGLKDIKLVIEAITEDIDIKLKIFRAIGEICPPETILATNTSSISITRIASVTKNPERVIGMHFMNPVPLIRLVEVIKGYKTSKEVVKKILKISTFLKKTPVVVNDYPGFIANRILMPMINEAIYSLYEGVAGVEEIDTIMKLGMAHPMGPLQLADFIGLDICLSILNVLYRDFGNSKYFPCPLLNNMVSAGNWGKKSGEGFYNWRNGTKAIIIADRFK